LFKALIGLLPPKMYEQPTLGWKELNATLNLNIEGNTFFEVTTYTFKDSS
jgi:hypothetical protein